ncbi:uncharacterized protein [Dysidea avara]|uniref:uncharacterized protein isoform X2 n=1 Tax=Dysidea avara TaxID=196820 RepID=UPI003322FC87
MTPFEVLLWSVYNKSITSYSMLGYDERTFNVQPHPVQFLQEPNDYVVLVGVDIKFVCSTTITTLNSNSINWLHDNTIIEPGPHYNITSDGHGTSILIVRNVTTDDQGEYHCCVNEWKNKVRTKYGHVVVLDNEDGLNNNITATYKSTVVLPCLFDNPVWFKNQTELSLQEVKQTMFVDSDSSLVVVGVTGEDNGEYHCQVNESGVVVNDSSYMLIVFEPTAFTKNPVIYNTSPSQYILIKPDGDNNCDQSPHNQTVTLQCQVTGHPSPVISWYHNGELVNFTDYFDNTTIIIVENNTWTLQGGDPCNIIGYWQCFATNNVGTVHSTTRVLPYGWRNPPGKPSSTIITISPLDQSIVTYNISWSPSEYYGGLNNSYIYYHLTISHHTTTINTTDTHAMVTLNNVMFNKRYTISVSIHYNYSTDIVYIPSNMLVTSHHDNLLCDTIGAFVDPKISGSCYPNGTAYFTLEKLSHSFVTNNMNAWRLHGSCVDHQNVVERSKYANHFSNNKFQVSNLRNGTVCSYQITAEFLPHECQCGALCHDSITCTIIIQCDNLTTPSNGEMTSCSSGSMGVGYEGDTCSFTCNTGYELTGSDTRTCQSNGSWSGSNNVCQRVPCISLTDPNNGMVYCSLGDDGISSFEDTCNFTCNTGYELTGSDTRTCQSDGSWSGTESMCKKVSCPPSVLPNGVVNCSLGDDGVHYYKDTCSFTCNTGYELMGSDTRTCQSDRSWSGIDNMCRRVTCHPFTDMNDGAVNCSLGEDGVHSYEDNCSTSCNTGYELTGSNIRICQSDGTWSGIKPMCRRVTCPPSALPNGVVNCSQGDDGVHSFGNTCSFTCNTGYELTGSDTRSCQSDGSWNGTHTECKKGSAVAGIIAVTVTLTLLLFGSGIVFCIVLCVYRHKNTGKNADVRFLKMSQIIKKMNPPVTENCNSTIDIAEASVCEVPTIKVTKWIENNNFQHSGDLLLKSESFNSLATSQMIAYICENDKKKSKGSCTPLPDYIEETSCQQYCRRTDDDLSSIQSLPLSCSGKCNAKPTKTSQLYPYYDENTFTNSSHQKSSCDGSLPEYMREAGDQSDSGDDSNTNMSGSSLSLDSISLPGSNYQSKRPQDLQINRENFMPYLSAYVSDSNCLNNSNSAPQKCLSYISKDDLDDCGDDSGLNTATTTMEPSESHFGYFELPSNKVKSEVNTTSISCQSSTSDLFELDDEVDDADHEVATFGGLTIHLKSVSDDDAQSSPASHAGSSTISLSEHYFDSDIHNVKKVSTVNNAGLSSGYVELPLNFENDNCSCNLNTQNNTSYISHYLF